MACTFNEKSGSRCRNWLDFDPEAIHVMRLNETEEEFDASLEAYGEDGA